MKSVTTVAFNKEGTIVLTGSSDGEIRTWDGETGKNLSTYKGAQQITSVTCSSNGSIILACDEKGAYIWNTTEPTEAPIFLPNVLQGIISPDSTMIITRSLTHIAFLSVGEANTIEQINSIELDNVTYLVFSPTGEILLTGREDGIVCLWNNALTPIETTHAIKVPYKINTLEVDRYETTICITTAEGVYFFDITTGIPLQTLQAPLCLDEIEGYPLLYRQFPGHEAFISSLIISSNGKTTLTGFDDGTAFLHNTETGDILSKFTPQANSIDQVAMSPDADIVITGSADGTARLWNAKTGELLNVLPPSKLSSSFSGGAFSPQGTVLVTLQKEGLVFWKYQSDTANWIALRKETALKLGNTICLHKLFLLKNIS